MGSYQRHAWPLIVAFGVCRSPEADEALLGVGSDRRWVRWERCGRAPDDAPAPPRLAGGPSPTGKGGSRRASTFMDNFYLF